MYIFDNEQKKYWKDNRFIVLRDFLENNVRKSIGSWCDELTSWPEVIGKWMKYYEKNAEGKSQLCRIENFIDYHPEMNAIATGKKTLKLISELMDEPAAIFKEKINYKFPNGGGFRPHQDAPAFISFNQKYHITIMVAIDPCTLENGCLQVAVNKDIQATIFPQEKDGSIKHEIANHLEWLPIECQPGDMILFDSYLPHYSEPNRSQGARRAMFITYNRLSEGGCMRTAYYQDKRKNFPPDFERDPKKDYSVGAAIYNVANPIGEK